MTDHKPMQLYPLLLLPLLLYQTTIYPTVILLELTKLISYKVKNYFDKYIVPKRITTDITTRKMVPITGQASSFLEEKIKF